MCVCFLSTIRKLKILQDFQKTEYCGSIHDYSHSRNTTNVLHKLHTINKANVYKGSNFSMMASLANTFNIMLSSSAQVFFQVHEMNLQLHQFIPLTCVTLNPSLQLHK